jgi:dUTP pyrophosphatase
MGVKVKIKRLPHSKGLPLPSYQTTFAAGADLSAAIDREQIIEPQERTLIPPGFCLGLPQGYEAQIRARSGLSVKHGITLINGVGTIDEDYRGEIKVGLVNLSTENWTLKRGTRIAQMIIAPYVQGEFIETETLSETSRGTGGFGSTG